MQSGQKQVVLGKREKERRERRKEKRKRQRIKEERRKKENKKERKERKWGKRVGEAIINKKNMGGSSDSVYFKFLDFPWNLSV